MNTCSYFIESKFRNCKFKTSPGSKYCYLHSKFFETEEKTNEDSIIPCPIDNKHFVSIKKIRSHIKKCSRIRDIAYELSQPFCIYNCKIPNELIKVERILDNLDGFIQINNTDINEIKNNKINFFEEKLEYLNIIHNICEYLFGINPHINYSYKSESNLDVNKHEIQAINISRKSKELFNIEEKEFNIDDDSLIVEFGAGNAILSYWFIKEMRNQEQEEDHLKIRNVVIDKESRRKQMEKLDNFIHSVRLRLDIELFDFNSLVEMCNNINKTEEFQKKKMYSSIEDGKIPWIIVSLLKLGVWIRDSKSRIIQEFDEIKKLDKEELKYILSNLSIGGGPDITKIERIFTNYFASRPIKDIFIISKHLCGNGIDLGFESALRVKNSMYKGSKLRIVMSTCCHHRCVFTQHLGVDLLNNLILIKKYFKNSEELFEFIKMISTWSTGTNDFRSNYGFKAKFILDCCRLHWLYENQFSNINYTNFIGKDITPENTLFTGTYNVI